MSLDSHSKKSSGLILLYTHGLLVTGWKSIGKTKQKQNVWHNNKLP